MPEQPLSSPEMQIPGPPVSTSGLRIPSKVVIVRIRGRGVHGVVPPSCVSPIVSRSSTPYQSDGARETGWPTAPEEELWTNVEPAIRALPRASVSDGVLGAGGGGASGIGGSSGVAVGGGSTSVPGGGCSPSGGGVCGAPGGGGGGGGRGGGGRGRLGARGWGRWTGRRPGRLGARGRGLRERVSRRRQGGGSDEHSLRQSDHSVSSGASDGRRAGSYARPPVAVRA